MVMGAMDGAVTECAVLSALAGPLRTADTTASLPDNFRQTLARSATRTADTTVFPRYEVEDFVTQMEGEAVLHGKGREPSVLSSTIRGTVKLPRKLAFLRPHLRNEENPVGNALRQRNSVSFPVQPPQTELPEAESFPQQLLRTSAKNDKASFRASILTREPSSSRGRLKRSLALKLSAAAEQRIG
jgi:hypothetical protein